MAGPFVADAHWYFGERLYARWGYATTTGQIGWVAEELPNESDDPIAVYRYVVDGYTLESSRRTFGLFGIRLDRAEAEAALAAYHAGEMVTVHYDRRRPHRSVLEMSVPPWRWATAAFIAPLPVLGLYLLVRAARSLCRSEQVE